MTGLIKRQPHASMKNLCRRLTLAGLARHLLSGWVCVVQKSF